MFFLECIRELKNLYGMKLHLKFKMNDKRIEFAANIITTGS